MKRFINDFNNKFEHKLTTSKLESLMYRLRVSTGKPNNSLYMSMFNYQKYKIGEDIQRKGYTYIKIDNKRDKTKTSNELWKINWKLKHVYIYERYYNVKIKNDEMVVFLDKNKNNFNIDNLLLVNRKEYGKMIVLQHIEDIEIRKTAYTICKLEYLTESI